MKITTLVENTGWEGNKDLQTEKGLSLHISYGDRQILSDTGINGAFAQNAKRLGIELQDVDFAVISHHHFDHGGGLAPFLKENSKARVYLRGKGVGEHYFRILGTINKYVGLDKRVFVEYSNRLDFIDKSTEISPGVFILTRIVEMYPQPKGNKFLLDRKDNTWSFDTFEHELILVIREDEGLVVFTGCSHRGILNIVETVIRDFSGVPIKAVIGGFHLISLPMFNTMSASKSEVESIGQAMLKYPIEKIYTGHCTGQKAYRILKQVMGERLAYISTGSSIEI